MTKATSPISRRRSIQIIASAAGLPLIVNGSGFANETKVPLTEWKGTALGAKSRILLAHPDEQRLRLSLARILNEIDRLENVFSLFRETSELVRLNRLGRLDRPSLDMRLVLKEAVHVGYVTDGAFDVTVQPLWRLLADHFADPQADPKGPDGDLLAKALQRVGYRKIDIGENQIAFQMPGMAVTLNGIAQGYMSDRAADILKEDGFDRTLVQLGETVALQPQKGESAWRIKIESGSPGLSNSTMLKLSDCALATSSSSAFQFDSVGQFTHLLDPKHGRAPTFHNSVSVVAQRGVLADALSTGLSLRPSTDWPDILARAGADYAIVGNHNGTFERVAPSA